MAFETTRLGMKVASTKVWIIPILVPNTVS